MSIDKDIMLDAVIMSGILMLTSNLIASSSSSMDGILYMMVIGGGAEWRVVGVVSRYWM